jgi:RHS repeat-associated protein
MTGVLPGQGTGGVDLINTNQILTLSAMKTPEQFAYDDDGNMLSDQEFTYAWNAENRMISVQSNAGVSPALSATYKYDHQGRRILKTVNGETTTFLWLGNHIISEISKGASQITNVFVWGQNDHLVSATLSGTNVFYAHDGNKNVTDLVDATGTLVAHYEFDPHGNINVKTGVLADVNPFRFSSEYYDLETGHFAFMLRYLDTVTASWMSRDPIQEYGGARLYGFVDNDPINRFDLYGMVFNITYIRFSALSGHGWIRTGAWKTEQVSFGQPVLINDKQQASGAVIRIPEGIGFYPTWSAYQSGKQGFRQLLLTFFIPVKGRYVDEQYEIIYTGANGIPAEEYETELISSTYTTSSLPRSTRRTRRIQITLERGSGEGKPCDCADKDQVRSCLRSFLDESRIYQVPFAMCRSRAKDALNACCLKTSEKSHKVEFGKIIRWTGVEDRPGPWIK